jgi:hypothetical protein
MDTVSIIQEIDAEISRLQQVRAILTGTDVKRAAGRPKSTQVPSSSIADEPTKRVLSAEARAKIAAGQKARWAKSKRADRKAAKKAAAVKTAPTKKAAKKPVKSAKPVKATKPVKEDKPEIKS